jgi:dsRNA-specific ribonuclease
MFKCTITCRLEGIKIVEDSGHYHPRKDDSKEFAAHKILLRLKEREKSRSSRGATGKGPLKAQATAATNTTTPTTSWKSKLKEHYDKQGMPGTELKYTTVDVEGRGFVSSIFVPDLRREVKGEPKKSKKEAEQNAAEKAIHLLYRS